MDRLELLDADLGLNGRGFELLVAEEQLDEAVSRPLATGSLRDDVVHSSRSLLRYDRNAMPTRSSGDWGFAYGSGGNTHQPSHTMLQRPNLAKANIEKQGPDPKPSSKLNVKIQGPTPPTWTEVTDSSPLLAQCPQQ